MKKQIVLCAVLVIELSLPVLADVSMSTPMLIDVNGGAGSGAKPGWQQWVFPDPWTGFKTNNFTVGSGSYSNITATLSAFSLGYSGNWPQGTRSRDGGMVFVGGSADLDYNLTATGLGMQYLNLSLAGLEPSREYQISLWGWEKHSFWSMNLVNPNSEWGVWVADQNPMDWLFSNGYGPGQTPGEPPLGGYGSKGMPEGLAAIVAANGARANLDCGDTDPGDAGLGSANNNATVRFVTTPYYDEDYPGGTVDIYGWMDSVGWAGGVEMPLSGFMVIPEPTTMALLSLGGLALIRGKRA